MFGRRPSPNSDSVALARRRLAALAAQFEDFAAGRAGDVSGAPSPGTTGTGSTADSRLPETDSGTATYDEWDGWDDVADFDDERDLADGAGAGGQSGDRRRSGASQTSPGRHTGRTSGGEYGRWALDTHHITVLALLLAAVLAVAAWFVLKATPHATPLHLTNERTVPSTSTITQASFGPGVPPVQTAPGGALGTPAAASASAAAKVVVDVTGKVRKPGIVELPAGSRVVDALKAAGGARPGVRTNTLNLARLLVDGEQIVVGLKVPPVDLVPSAPVSGGSSTGAITPVDLNTATQQQLETLPGIGPVTAAAILQWRTENGSFSSVDQLLDVSGIGDVTLANIEAYVHV